MKADLQAMAKEAIAEVDAAERAIHGKRPAWAKSWLLACRGDSQVQAAHHEAMKALASLRAALRGLRAPGPCAAATLAETGAIDPAEVANPDDAPIFCEACEAGDPPGGDVGLACLFCGHRSCERGA